MTSGTRTDPFRKWVAMFGFALASMASGGGWYMHDRNAQTAVHESKQDTKIHEVVEGQASNEARLDELSYMFILEGRHMEKMIRAAAKGEPIPDRPRELADLETRIMAGSRGR